MKKQLFNFSPKMVEYLRELRLDLNDLYAIEYIENKPEYLILIPMETLQKLVRKGYLVQDGETNIVSSTGKALLDAFYNENEAKKPEVKSIKEEQMSDFNKWWAVFPSHDSFTHKGKSFGKTRGLRINRKECEKLFLNLVNSRKYTAAQIIKATENDVNLKKELSVKFGVNKLSYLQNSATYLRQESFEPHLDTETEKIVNIPPPDVPTTSVVDI